MYVRSHIYKYVRTCIVHVSVNIIKLYHYYIIEFNCPCAAHPGTEPLTPDYVGDHYYCDTATYYEPKHKWYTNNTQWDGKDYYPGSKCCNNECLPWFWRTLPQETSDDVEVRWCTSHGIGNAKVSTELLISSSTKYY